MTQTPDFNALVAAITKAVRAARVRTFRLDNSVYPPAFSAHLELDDMEYSLALTPLKKAVDMGGGIPDGALAGE